MSALRYYKIIEEEYITAIGTGFDGEEITEEEYNNLLQIIRTKPIAEESYDYRLKNDDLNWELYEVPPTEVDPDAEIGDSEALSIILGGDSE